MIASRVAEVEELLRNRVENYPLPPEPKPITRRDLLLATTVVVGSLVVIILWGTGILMSLFAKLFM